MPFAPTRKEEISTDPPAYRIPTHDGSVLVSDETPNDVTTIEKPKAESKAEPKAEPKEEPKQLFLDYNDETENVGVKESSDDDYRIVGEVYDAYAIVEKKDGIYFIDKHAAHERILYEQLRSRNAKYAQQLFEPMIVPMTPSECDVLDANKELLGKYGFEFEINGTDIALTSIPDTLLQSASDVPNYIETLAEKLSEGDTLSVEERTDRALFTVACKAALKAGVANHIAHTEWVVRRVMTDEGIRYCPHGRPIMRRIEKREIDKFFDR